MVGVGVAVNCMVLVGLGDEITVLETVIENVGVAACGRAVRVIVGVIVGNILVNRFRRTEPGLLDLPSDLQVL